MMSAEGGDWQAEWHETVQRVVEADQGWAWKGFWNMVKNALQRPPAAVSPEELRQCFILQLIFLISHRRSAVQMLSCFEVGSRIVSRAIRHDQSTRG